MLFLSVLRLIFAFCAAELIDANDGDDRRRIDREWITLKNCDGETYSLNRIISDRNDSVEQSSYIWPDEDEVARRRNLAGIIADSYDVRVSMITPMSYNTQTTIRLRLVESTDRLLFNLHESVWNGSAVELLIPRSMGSIFCLKESLFNVKSQSIALVLNNSCPPGTRFKLRINVTDVQPRVVASNGKTSKSAVPTEHGLLFAGDDHSWTLVTAFQMRMARTVFACLDHPSLKATFRLTVDVPTTLIVVSNTDQIERSASVDGREITYRFAPTPAISTYSFAFAISTDRLRAVDDVQSPIIRVYGVETPFGYAELINESRSIIDWMTTITDVPFTIPTLTYVICDSTFDGAIANFGLITMSPSQGALSTKTDRITLAHQLAHMWIGNLKTVSSWKELCLQEGLVQYLAWRYAETVRNINGARIAAQQLATVADQLWSDGVIRNFQTMEETLICYTKTPLYIYMIGAGENHSIWKRFLQNLFADNSTSIVDYASWLRHVAMASNASETAERLREAFEQPGHSIFVVKTYRSSRKIVINQMNFQRNAVLSDGPLLTVRTELLSMSGRKPVTISGRKTTVCIQEPSVDWLLLDPETNLFGRKIYSVTTYLNLHACYLKLKRGRATTVDCSGLNRTIVVLAFDDFCFGLLNNLLTDGRNSTVFTDRSRLAEFATSMRQMMMEEVFLFRSLNGTCGCCLQLLRTVATAESPANASRLCSGKCKPVRIISNVLQTES